MQKALNLKGIEKKINKMELVKKYEKMVNK